MGLSGQLHDPTALPRTKIQKYPLNMLLDGPQVCQIALENGKNLLFLCRSPRILVTVPTQLTQTDKHLYVCQPLTL